MFKSEYFDYYHKTREAEGGVKDVKYWLSLQGSIGWGKNDVPLRMGTMLGLLDSRKVFGAFSLAILREDIIY